MRNHCSNKNFICCHSLIRLTIKAIALHPIVSTFNSQIILQTCDFNILYFLKYLKKSSYLVILKLELNLVPHQDIDLNIFYFCICLCIIVNTFVISMWEGLGNNTECKHPCSVRVFTHVFV